MTNPEKPEIPSPNQIIRREPTREENREWLERRMILRVQEGDTNALKSLVSMNLGAIKKIAFKYTRFNLPFDELINEGVLGFIHAVQKFDPDQKVQLMTYASYWVKHFILEFLAYHSQTLTMPLKKARVSQKISLAIKDLRGTLGRNPTIEELSQSLQMPPEEIRKMLPVTFPVLSLEKYSGSEEKTPLGDLIPDPGALNPEEEAINHLLKKRLQEIITDFNPKDKEIMGYYFGLNDVEPKSLREIGKSFNMSQEGVRKIIHRVLAKLKNQNWGVNL